MPATDYQTQQAPTDQLGAYEHAEAATPSDVAELSFFARALYVGGAGNVVLVTRSGAEVTFTGVPVGTILPVQTKQVKATGTTATSIVALV